VSLCSIAILWGADSVPPGPPRRTGGFAILSGGERFETTVRPFVSAYCSGCHNEKVKTAGLNLLEYRDPQAVLADREKWERVSAKLRSGEMPPKGLPRPSPEDVQTVAGWIDDQFDRADLSARPDPGRLTAHRLNRTEYFNTIQDLLAVDFVPAKDFPADDSGYGFDNIGDVLSVSPLLMEKYLAAAEQIARKAIAREGPPKPTRVRYRHDAGDYEDRTVLDDQHRFPAEGDYELRVAIGGRQEPATLQLSFDGASLNTFTVAVDENDNPRAYEVRIHVAPGVHGFNASLSPREGTATETAAMAKLKADGEEELRKFIEKKHPSEAALAKKKKELHGKPVGVDSIEILGPYNASAPPQPEAYARVFRCGHARGRHTLACVRQNLAEFVPLAFRRPVSDAEVNRLVRLVSRTQQDGLTIDQGMRLALEAILVSPHFLFRIERDPKPNDPVAIHAVNDYELASRLSYFLWSSMPDAELLRVAGERRLHDPAVIRAQTRRMLADLKSARLIDNFGGQWLELRKLESAHPDPEVFPKFDDALRRAMRTETTLFLKSIVDEDRSILDLLDAPYTFVNQRLARHYGISGVHGKQFQRVSLEGTERGGILTQASILTVTSYPTRTSPVLRGKWILENVLNAPPPPPPPGVGSLDEKGGPLQGTMRQQIEAHRANPACASCHSRMDPLGFALENYDAVGAWRTREGTALIDATGTLPNGKAFSGPGELKSILKSDRATFAECLTDKMLTYALGRGLEPYDRPAVRQISRRLAAEDYRFSSLIMGIVESAPFQMGRGDGGKKK
jgi:hypothetical protein